MVDVKVVTSNDPKEYVVRVLSRDVSIALSGEVIVSGTSARRIRDFLLAFPDSYMTDFVPFLRKSEPSFEPSELWFDADGRIHVTNRKLIRRARQETARSSRSQNSTKRSKGRK